MTDAIPELSHTPDYYTCISFVMFLDFKTQHILQLTTKALTYIFDVVDFGFIVLDKLQQLDDDIVFTWVFCRR